MPADTTIPRDKQYFPVWMPVTLRYSDQDPMQHINNVAITAFLESGRLRLLQELFTGQEIGLNGTVLAQLSIDYLAEISFPGTVDVGCRLTAIGTKSITSQYAVFQETRCCVVSQAINVFFDTKARCAIEPTPQLRAAMQEFMDQQ